MNKSLQILVLSFNNIGYNGTRELANTLKVNTSIQELSLYSNNIGDKGTIEIANALKMNTSLRQLELDCNNIGDIGLNIMLNIQYKLNVNRNNSKLKLSLIDLLTNTINKYKIAKVSLNSRFAGTLLMLD